MKHAADDGGQRHRRGCLPLPHGPQHPQGADVTWGTYSKRFRVGGVKTHDRRLAPGLDRLARPSLLRARRREDLTGVLAGTPPTSSSRCVEAVDWASRTTCQLIPHANGEARLGPPDRRDRRPRSRSTALGEPAQCHDDPRPVPARGSDRHAYQRLDRAAVALPDAHLLLGRRHTSRTAVGPQLAIEHLARRGWTRRRAAALHHRTTTSPVAFRSTDADALVPRSTASRAIGTEHRPRPAGRRS